MINISIVTGTYNRLSLLKTMVSSVRYSIGKGLGYEIVVVDGGSTDETLEWCKNQLDIKLIEQGELLGAVKAFNAGAYAARGKYVILSNDDVSFINDSILRSYSFMEDNLNVGIGCFYQDRHKKNFYVDRMGAVTESGDRRTVYYGQVCIVPKWLGDKVGWWGDYLHTYGGDNELSCNVIELGYDILPIECACIHDFMHNDKLRQINQSNNDGTMHRDSRAFREKWPLGPTIRKSRNRVEEKRRLRLLYAPIYEQGNKLQQKTKFGLFRSLRSYYDVIEVDYTNNRSSFGADLTGVDDLYYTAQAFRPDIFLLQAHDGQRIPLNIIRLLKDEHPRSIFASWNGDYSPRNFTNSAYLELLRMMHLATFVTVDYFDYYKSIGIGCQYWQIGYEEFTEATLMPDDPRYDVIFQGNEYSEQRTYLGHILRDMPNSGIFGFWKSIKADGSTYYDYSMQDKLYRSSKICVSDQQFPKSVGYVSNRLFQAMRSGVFVLQQKINDMEKYIGAINGKHLIEWTSVEELPDLIAYWLAHPAERESIAKAGKDFVMRNHSFDVRAKEFVGFMSKYF